MIDSHAHYSHTRFDGTYRYLTVREGEIEIAEGNRAAIFEEMKRAGFTDYIEPAIGIDSNRRVLDWCHTSMGFAHPAVGVHPTRTYLAEWSDRHLLEDYTREEGVVAIGETGLDYHHPRLRQHRHLQKKWFRYQLGLASRRGLPLILHIREADNDAVKILRRFRSKIVGGVAHCFYGDYATAKQYLDLGLHIGIGGGLLQASPRAEALREAVKSIPLERILLETDAPYVLPDRTDAHGNPLPKKARNTSLLIPLVAEEIARIKGLDVQAVLSTTTANAKRLFKI